MAKVTAIGSNNDVLKAIYQDASDLYKDVVPDTDGTVSSYEAAYNAVRNNEAVKNEFINSLINLIGQTYVNAKSWQNPLKFLYSNRIRYGSTIEEIAFQLFQSKVYEPNTENPGDAFKVTKPNVMSMFHQINYERHFDATINETTLMKAFLNEGGLADLVQGIMTTLYNSAENEDYTNIRSIMTTAYNDGKITRLSVADPTTSEANAKALVKAIRTLAIEYGFISRKYNVAGADTHTTGSDLCLFVRPDVLATLDVDVLSMAFHMEKADIMGRLVPVDSFANTNIVAILADKDAFVIHDKLFETRSIYDPAHLNYNIFLHKHAMYSFSEFCNIVALTTDTDAGVITDVAITQPVAATVAPGSKTTLVAQLTIGDDSDIYTTDPQYADDVVWSLKEPVKGVSIKNGVLAVDSKVADGTKFTVVVSDVDDDSTSASKNITVRS